MISFGSVCSGIEAASVAWAPLGWKAAWFSEIEPFPCAVLKHHYPTVPNLGDMTALPHRILSGEIEAPDMLCGGTPCQAFSVAGLRNSLDDHRGNLTLTFVETANAIDERRLVRGLDPAIIFWENVPGVLNTKDNAFGCFLAGLAGEDDALVPPGGRWTNAGFIDGPQRAVAWRVLDAQYFGVAQRRRRVFVVASARHDFDPAAVLFEFDGVRRDTAPSRETGKVAPTIPSRSTAGGGLGTDFDCDGGLTTWPTEVAPTLDAHYGTSVSDALTCSQQAAIAYPIDTQNMTEGHSSGGKGFGGSLDPSFTLTKGHSHAVAYGFQPRIARNGHGDMGDVVNALTAASTGASDAAPHIAMRMQVRRLTPTECERLMGFPDGYTNIPWRGKPESPDGPRYKALGNSWAVPVVRWIGERINRAL